jgi:hypothetical protein
MSTYGFKRPVRPTETPTPKASFWPQERPNRRQEILRNEVRGAVAKLDRQQREFIERFYFMGETYEQIERRTGKERHRLETVHRQALERLRFLLTDFVEGFYGIRVEREGGCPICDHPRKAEIEEVLREKRAEESWRPTLEILREKFNLEVSSVWVLVAHLRKHM